MTVPSQRAATAGEAEIIRFTPTLMLEKTSTSFYQLLVDLLPPLLRPPCLAPSTLLPSALPRQVRA